MSRDPEQIQDEIARQLEVVQLMRNNEVEARARLNRLVKELEGTGETISLEVLAESIGCADVLEERNQRDTPSSE